MFKKTIKKKIHLFIRKPVQDEHFSVENFYFELFKNFKDRNIEIKFKICPLISKGIFNRIYLCIWAFFNQGSINHICGDINFISIFMNRHKTTNTFLDFYSMKRLKGLKKIVYFTFWIKIPFFKSKSVITISNKVKRELKIFLGLKKKENINTIGICISPNFKRKIKKKIDKKLRILVVGTAINKNISNIISSVKSINCELILIGKLNDEIIQKLKIYKISYRNLVSISKNSLIKEYKDCDILLFVSNYEGFGMPILEAQSVGRPVITSKFEPMKTVAGNAALFVNPKRVGEISNSIDRLLKNQNLRNSLIKKGFDNIKGYKKEVILKKHLKVYNKVINDL